MRSTPEHGQHGVLTERSAELLSKKQPHGRHAGGMVERLLREPASGSPQGEPD